jgi:hypothetical protein
MNDVLTLAVFAAKVLCLIVFVSVLKPDGSIGAVQMPTTPADCTNAFGKSGGNVPADVELRGAALLALSR